MVVAFAGRLSLMAEHCASTRESIPVSFSNCDFWPATSNLRYFQVKSRIAVSFVQELSTSALFFANTSDRITQRLTLSMELL